MNYTICRIIIPLAAILIATGAYFINKRVSTTIDRIKKLIAIFLTAITFGVAILNNEAISIVIGLNRGPSPFGDALSVTAFAAILLWLTYAAIFISIFSQFCEYPSFKYMSAFFSLPVYLLDLVFLKT